MSITAGEERAALLLKNMPSDLADAVLARMEPDRASRLREGIREVSVALALVQKTNPNDVLHKFMLELRKAAAPAPAAIEPATVGVDEYIPGNGNGGAAPAIAPSAALATTPASEPVAKKQTATKEPEPLAVDDDVVDAMRKLGIPCLAAVLKNERIATVAIALSRLPVEEATEVLKQFPPEKRRETTLRLARGVPGTESLHLAVARAVTEVGRQIALDPESLDGEADIRKLATLLRGLEREERKEVLENLAQSDPETAEKVKGLLYVFEDLLRIEDRSVQALLAEIEIKTLAIALTEAPAELAEKVNNNLSQRARDTLSEEMGLMGKPRATAVKTARTEVIGVIQRLDVEGKLTFKEE